MADFRFQAEGKKVTNRDEQKILQVELWLETAQLGFITDCRGVSGFIEVGGQVVIKVVMRRGAAAGGAFYPAKKWGGNCPPCPPSLTPLVIVLKFASIFIA